MQDLYCRVFLHCGISTFTAGCDYFFHLCSVLEMKDDETTKLFYFVKAGLKHVCADWQGRSWSSVLYTLWMVWMTLQGSICRPAALDMVTTEITQGVKTCVTLLILQSPERGHSRMMETIDTWKPADTLSPLFSFQDILANPSNLTVA